MTLLREAPRQVVTRLVTFETHLKNFARLHAVEPKSGTHEGHWASVGRYVYQLTCGHHFIFPR